MAAVILPVVLPHRRSWNHNTRYHNVLMRSVPYTAERALDVGSGDGRFARELAGRVTRVTAIDADLVEVEKARSTCAHHSNVTVEHGNFMELDFAPRSFDVVAALASLHHMPFEAAVERMTDLLRPGGRLIVLGVWTDADTRADMWWNRAGSLANKTYQFLWGPDVMSAPATAPDMTLRVLRTEVARLLPGATVRRHLLWRYELVWTKPNDR